MKLSKTMERAISKLSKTEWKSSYDINESLNTLSALRSRGLVESRSELGSIFSPQTAIKWRILP